MRERIRVCWVGNGPTPETQTQADLEHAPPLLTVTRRSIEWLRETASRESTDDPDSVHETTDCFVLDLDTETLHDEIGDSGGPTPFAVVVPDDDDVTTALETDAADVFRRETVTTEPALVARRLESIVDAAAARPSTTIAPTVPDRLRRYRTVVEATPDPMYVLDASGQCVLANDALARFTGYDRATLLGSHASSFIGADDFERANDALTALLADDELTFDRFEFTLETAEGDARIGEATVTPVTDDGRVLGSVGVIRDVSERARRTRELARYRTLVETAPIGLFALDEAGTITWANDEFVGPFEESADDIVGLSFATLIDRGYFEPAVIEQYADHVQTLLSDGNDVSEITHEPTLHTRDGDVRTYRATLAALPLEDGEFTGTVNAFREVTEERRYQRELERQNDRLEQFASLVSHDLRNPLNVAAGHVELLAADIDHDSVAEVSWALDRMETLIQDLLTLARQGETVGAPERVDLAAIVDEAWAVVDGPATLECQLEGTVVADRSRLRELFTNVFRNSVEHGRPSSHATGSTATAADGKRSDAAATGPSVRLTVGWLDESTDRPTGFYVEDDGIGLPDEAIFDVGVTTSPDGTGLGLAIVREIVEAHGWTVTSGEGANGGARFEIRRVEATRTETDGSRAADN